MIDSTLSTKSFHSAPPYAHIVLTIVHMDIRSKLMNRKTPERCDANLASLAP